MFDDKGNYKYYDNKCNNGGFTLVELIVAIAVAGSVMVAIVFFMNVSLNQYRAVNADVTLQMEAQSAVDYIGEFMMEAKFTPVKICDKTYVKDEHTKYDYTGYLVEVPYSAVPVDETPSVSEDGASSVSPDSAGILILYQKEDNGNGKLYTVSDVSLLEMLYTDEKSGAKKIKADKVDDKIEDILSDSNAASLNDSLIAERISDFSLEPALDTGDELTAENPMETVSVTVYFDGKSKKMSADFRLRNA